MAFSVRLCIKKLMAIGETIDYEEKILKNIFIIHLNGVF